MFFFYKIFLNIDSSNIYTLKLSSRFNDELIDQILDNKHFSLSKFNNLRSLTLNSIGLFTLNSIICQEFYLNNLHSFTIRFRSGLCKEKLLYMYKIILYKFISRFQSLKSLCLSILDTDTLFNDINISYPIEYIEKNLSLKYISIENICMNNLEPFFTCFPNLENFNGIIRFNRFQLNYPLLTQLISCTLNIRSFTFQSLVNLLKSCRNLKQLFVSTAFDDWNVLADQELDDTVENHLSNLKKFRFHIFNRDDTENSLHHSWCKKLIEEQFWSERKTKLNLINETSINDEIVLTDIIIEFSI